MLAVRFEQQSISNFLWSQIHVFVLLSNPLQGIGFVKYNKNELLEKFLKGSLIMLLETVAI